MVGPDVVIRSGLAPDGGLWLPEKMPQFDPDEIRDLATMSHADLAAGILWPFFACAYWTFTEFHALVRAAYGAQWQQSDIVPVVPLRDGIHILELFHGPTLAFKDVALQALGKVLTALLAMLGERITQFTATSGDTGSATMAAFAGSEAVECFVAFPHELVSEFQRRQMTTVTAPNVHAMALRGNFDTCQKIAKSLRWPSANSINFFRVAAQIPYFAMASLLVQALTGAEKVPFAVPCGNLGDLYAGICAKYMGFPIGELIAGTNHNRMLVPFVNDGLYRPSSVDPSIAPSMDIDRSSNSERLVCDAAGAAFTKDAYTHLDECGEFRVNTDYFRTLGLRADWTPEEGCIETIRRVYERNDGYVLDPHSAYAYAAGTRLRNPTQPLVVLATASPVKFAPAIKRALGFEPAIPPQFAGIFERSEHMEVLPATPEAVNEYIKAVVADRIAA